MIEQGKQQLSGPDPLGLLLISEDLSLRGLVSALLTGSQWLYTAVTGPELNAVLAQKRIDVVMLDANESEMVIELALTKIRESCSELWQKILVIRGASTSPSMLELIERHALHQVLRENLPQQLWTSLQDVIAPQRLPEVPLQSMHTAELTFDSSRSVSPTGLRGFRSNCRQLVYRHRSSTIDLLIEPREDSGRIAITGQVLQSPKTNQNDVDLPVLLVSGVRTMTRTTTNELGEFCLECTPVQEACVELRLREGPWVSLLLGELDRGVGATAE